MNEENEQAGEMTIIDGNAGALIVRAEIDSQIATAKAYPRDLMKFDADLRALACQSTAIAELCTYSVPRDGKQITGPSARFAELLLYAYRNVAAAGRIIEIGERTVTAQGVCHDLENNTKTMVEVTRSIMTSAKGGRRPKRYSDDMIRTTCLAAISIAKRNAILAGIPRALWDEAYGASVERAEGSADELPERRRKMLAAFEREGISWPRIAARAKVREADEIGIKKLLFLRSLYVAIKDGDMSVDEAFPKPGEQAAAASGSSLDRLAEETAGQAADENAPESEPKTQESPETALASADAEPAEGPTAPQGEREAEAEPQQSYPAADATGATLEAEADPDANAETDADLRALKLTKLAQDFKRRIGRTITQSGLDKIAREIETDASIPGHLREQLLEAVDRQESEIGSA